ncbi:MAG: hypothetical protein BGO21_05250 [Dyadobacter sp. 50-39]|uniref:CcmD family protein n=1 Tax=Dyadobacter sp. 50-39 TaxID=1895756 RepID=UPI00095BBE9F|nr:CcmD family protein [Dyadobacter sp. 50-39]OJV22565.1 MAG: hypothetical protein BGO21_05250 [Dyadobacter sp. 50-39]
MKNSSKFKLIHLIVVLVTYPITCMGQSQGPVSQALRQDGKLWVVIAVIAVVLAGITFYLSRLQRKVNRLKGRTR